MKKYLDVEGFLDFISDLEIDKPKELYVESIEDGGVNSYTFKKETFGGDTIVLYETPYACVGLITDSYMYDADDYAEGVFEDFEHEGEYKLFIKE